MTTRRTATTAKAAAPATKTTTRATTKAAPAKAPARGSTKAAPAKAPARGTTKAAPAKAPTRAKEMTREQKRAVAVLLIERAGELVKGWSAAAKGQEDLRDVSREVAAELIANWLSYCPGAAWHPALGERPRGGKRGE